MDYSLELIEKVAEEQLKKECRLCIDKSFMPPGHNGPYFDIETPVRNTSHWLVVYSVLWRQTKKDHYKDISLRLLNYLLYCDLLAENVYIHRQKKGKDWCNGVIGQAWVIESLVTAGVILGVPEAVSHANAISKAFSFDKKVKAWIRVDPRNGQTQIDYTLNHQLWYAAALSMLRDKNHDSDINDFLLQLNNGGMRVRPDGTISHLFYGSSSKGFLLQGLYCINEFRKPGLLQVKEVGYHLYNIHPLARLYQRFSDHPFFESDNFKKALSRAFSDDFFDELENNQYSYPYNAPGFEIALPSYIFQQEGREKIWHRQLEKTYSRELISFSNGVPDSLVLNSRVYEILIGAYLVECAVDC